MKLAIDENPSDMSIRAYEAGFVQINDTRFKQSLIVTTKRVIPDWPPQQMAHLTHEHVQQLVHLRPEVILLGTGLQLQFPKPEIVQLIYQERIGLEVMDTGAACRTFNILSSEGRPVVAALFMIQDEQNP